MFEFTEVDVINNVLVFSTLRNRLVSRRRNEALPALVGLVLGYLDDNRLFRKIGKSVVRKLALETSP